MQLAQDDAAGALKSIFESLAIRERLAQSDPGNTNWQRDLSVAYTKIGDVQAAQGDLAAALKSFRDSFAIAERLAQADPDNAVWQRDLAALYSEFADIYKRIRRHRRRNRRASKGRRDRGAAGQAVARTIRVAARSRLVPGTDRGAREIANVCLK